jgi:hypothetical protein
MTDVLIFLAIVGVVAALLAIFRTAIIRWARRLKV